MLLKAVETKLETFHTWPLHTSEPASETYFPTYFPCSLERCKLHNVQNVT